MKKLTIDYLSLLGFRKTAEGVYCYGSAIDHNVFIFTRQNGLGEAKVIAVLIADKHANPVLSTAHRIYTPITTLERFEAFLHAICNVKILHQGVAE